MDDTHTVINTRLCFQRHL